MAGGILFQGGVSGTLADVDSNNQVKVALPTSDAATGKVRMMSEVDNGAKTGTALLLSPEADEDYRLRIGQDTPLDVEVVDYAAQNTAKHAYGNTTMTAAWGSGFLTTNSGSITTTTTGLRVKTYQLFPLTTSAPTYAEAIIQFNNTGTGTNTTIDIGFFLDGGSNPFAPTDGAYFRFNSSGCLGVVNYNNSETTTAAFSFSWVANTSYKFAIEVGTRFVRFWIEDVLYATISSPSAAGQPFISAALPFALRHVIVGGAASATTQMKLASYTVSQGGWAQNIPAALGRALAGGTSAQGQSGGTMGSTENYGNSANPTAAVPTNTTAALGAGLGGQYWETDTLAVNTDGIICTYQVPAGSTTVPGRALAIYGVTVDSYVQTGLTGGGYNAQWVLRFGHTALSLATGEAATTKAPRNRSIGSNTVASGATALTQLTRVGQQWQAPIVVNPGEFVAVVKKKVGTAPSGGTIAHMISIDAVWI